MKSLYSLCLTACLVLPAAALAQAPLILKFSHVADQRRALFLDVVLVQ